jgi:uncharacterized glyoxalase superfamily protein PhnB
MPRTSPKWFGLDNPKSLRQFARESDESFMNANESNESSEIREVFPYLRVKGASDAIEFYKRAFGAVERYRLTEPSGRVGHAELLFGHATVMVADEDPERGILGPQSTGGPRSFLHLRVANADTMAARAVSAGATLTRPLKDQFYGERSCVLRDPFGHEWMLGHEIEKVSAVEMQRRFTAMLGG